MSDTMRFPKDWQKFVADYSFTDNKEIYTDGAVLIPVFRVQQMMEHYHVKTDTEAELASLKELVQKQREHIEKLEWDRDNTKDCHAELEYLQCKYDKLEQEAKKLRLVVRAVETLCGQQIICEEDV